jgi:hypothetical protein
MPVGIYPRTKEHNKKISEALKLAHKDTNSGYNSPDVRKRISDSVKIIRNEPNSVFNTKEYLKKLSDKAKGKMMTKESKRRLSKYWKKYYESHEHISKGKPAHNKGKKCEEYISPEKIDDYRQKLSDLRKGKTLEEILGKKKGKKARENYSIAGKKRYIERIRKLPYYWNNVPFASNMELECAKTLLKEPLYGINCHIAIGNKIIDFFPREDDYLFNNCLVEFHPCPQYGDSRTIEEYYEERNNIIANSQYKNIPFVLISEIKNVSDLKEISY